MKTSSYTVCWKHPNGRFSFIRFVWASLYTVVFYCFLIPKKCHFGPKKCCFILIFFILVTFYFLIFSWTSLGNKWDLFLTPYRFAFFTVLFQSLFFCASIFWTIFSCIEKRKTLKVALCIFLHFSNRSKNLSRYLGLLNDFS